MVYSSQYNWPCYFSCIRYQGKRSLLHL
uniref:Uncharacterized protein n=1 Tax=Rhizophora mucronata TaxID=61149 RepID=A0A2P2NAF9_RHIMU